MSINLLILCGIAEASHVNKQLDNSLVLNKTLKEVPLRLLSENYPPLNYIDTKGNAVGPAVDIVTEIQRLLKSDNKIEIMPFKRGYVTALNMENTAMFSMVNNEERSNLFKWVGPVATKRYAFFAKKKSNITITSFDDIAQYRVGVQIGGATEKILQSKKLVNIWPVSSPSQNIDKLMAGRIDLWFAPHSSVLMEARKMELDLHDIEEVFVAKHVTLWIGFNILTAAHIILSWQQALNSLYKNGFIKRSFEKYKLMSLYTEIKSTK